MSAERKRKKDGSVSEEAHGSWGSLITVMAAGETRGMKDTRDGVQQTWQESLSRDEMNQPIQQPSLLLLIWGCDITSSPRRSADGAGSRWSRSVLVKKKKKKGRGSECIVLWHMDWALNYCQSSGSQRLRISHEELCMVKMFGVQRERQLIRPNVHMHRYGNHRSELLKSNFTTCFSPDASDPTAEAHVRRCSYPSSVARKSELADGSTDPWQDFPSRN